MLPLGCHACDPPNPTPTPTGQALASRIQAKRLCLGQVDRILHARVPILKFRDVSGEGTGRESRQMGA